MPAQKRNWSSADDDNIDDGVELFDQNNNNNNEDEEEEEEQQQQQDSDESSYSEDQSDPSEWILVELPVLRTDVQCPICLGIIKKTRTVMECMHRFCRECIDKSMRLGNNECPACRTHCASRRSLRDDPRFDALIEILYEDIERYEEEELAFHEEEENRNKQIQDSIAQISQRQSEALVIKRKRRKEKALTKYRDSYPKRKRKTTPGPSHEGSEDNEDENSLEGNRDLSEDEREEEIIRPKRYKRKAKAHASPSTANSDFGGIENDLLASKRSKASPLRTPEMLAFAWGGGGTRSKNVRNTRVMKLTRYLESRKENDDEIGVNLILTRLENQSTPSLQQLYLCCPPHFSVENLKEHVALEALAPAEDIEILLVKEHDHLSGNNTIDPQGSTESQVVMQVLTGNETLAEVRENYARDHNHLVLAYRL